MTEGAETLAELAAKLRRYEASYRAGEPEISDAEFDALADRYTELADALGVPEDERLDRAPGDDHTTGFETVEHRVPMLSLEKLSAPSRAGGDAAEPEAAHASRAPQLRAWLGRARRELDLSADAPMPLVVEPKIDGISVSLTYERARLVRATTRGDGRRGDVITAQARAARAVPETLDLEGDGSIEIRGELYWPRSAFDAYNDQLEARGWQFDRHQNPNCIHCTCSAGNEAAIEGYLADLRDELGDLLFQVVFHARMAEEGEHFDFGDVVEAVSDKMERRHPHVFADADVADAEAQTAAWEEHKRREREAKGEDRSALAGIAHGLPEWQRAIKLQKRAARVGFDWPGPGPVFDKLAEEIDEVRVEFDAVAQDDSDAVKSRLEDEIGDLLFVAANLARHAKVDPGAALRRANAKFERRFRRMEQLAASDGIDLSQLPLQAQDAYWDRAKAEEREEGTA